MTARFDIGETFARAMREFEAGRLIQARDLARRIEKAAPLFGGAHYLLGLVALEQGQPRRAVQHLSRAIAITPGVPALHMNMGRAEQAVGDLAAASQHYASAATLAPDYAEAHAALGTVQRRRGDAQAAAAAFRRALDAKPGLAAAHAGLAGALLDLGAAKEALPHAEQAVERGDGQADAWLVLGLARRKCGDPDGARAAFAQAASLAPALASARFCLGEALAQAGDDQGAAAELRAYLALDPTDVQGAALLLANLGAASVPDRAPDAYVTALFDDYADRFDAELTGTLRYRAPDLLAAALDRTLGADVKGLDVLDAGCGTGLCAPFLRARARRLDGVDLSPRMVEKAAARGVYDGVQAGDMVRAMRQRPAAYDLIVAADVLVYVGPLEDVFAAASAALRPGGVFAFTVEKGESRVELGVKNRYRHSRAYVESCAAAAGFAVCAIDEAATRHEAGQPVESLVCMLRV